jgi:ATP-dependent helicase/nuclease subunit A
VHVTDVPDDRAAREAALDPTRSFIVQAPAGSGKTELLIQRYLKLLASVAEPEQVVAITFTRKAAAEMRNRVLDALSLAASPAEPAEPPHRVKTRTLAAAVLTRAAARAWALLEQPQRLRIDTLDALNAWLAQRLPVLAGGVAGARIAEDAAALYRDAARRTLEQLASDSPAGLGLRLLLPTLDNSIERMERLLAQLLPKRDQWLRHLAGVDDAALRRQLEAGLAHLVGDETRRLRAAWPEDTLPALVSVLGHAAEHAEPDLARDALRAAETGVLPAGGPGALAAWRAVAALLLTKQGRWRRRPGDKRHGFGARQPDARRVLGALLERLAGRDELARRLAAVAALPEPRYSDADWRDLTALKDVLLHLVAELRVLFAETRSVDFVELGMAAQRALGRVDAPSELLLALDQRIQHLMVDEFQDTSHAQVRLLELLTSGWEAGDGRSLFLVGDPMQSIYRFRDADVSLFGKIKTHGLSHVRLTPLALTNNYRSAEAVVDWVNRAFADAFGDADEAAGGIRFHSCRAARQPPLRGGVEVHAVAGAPGAETAAVTDILGAEQRADPSASIAVLVQSRHHLVGLHERLIAAGWPVRAVEIDAVADRQTGQDLIGLARALSHVGDRVAWLALLRAPWCGLTWTDLHRLCGDDEERAVWALIHDPVRVGQLSQDGRLRLDGVRAVLEHALERRGQTTFSRWAEHTWRALDGPACLEHPVEHETAAHFFARLDALAPGGDLPDPAELEFAFSNAAGQGEPPAGAGIEVMTIHRAKGLEFDIVVLFGLARAPGRDDTKALYWMERRADDGDDLLMAPLPRGSNRLAQLLQRIDRGEEERERARLLYVAATRAKRRLHLVAHHDGGETPPGARTMLRVLWPRLAPVFAAPAGAAPTAGRLGGTPPLRRLRDVAARPAIDAPAVVGAAEAPEFEWVGQAAVQIGALVHRYLQRIAETGLAAWDGQRLRRCAPRLRAELELLGVEPEELDDATRRVVDVLERVLQDPRGRWALTERPDAESELRLTIRTDAGLEHVQLDRTFVDEDGTRWIVDYKTSRHEGGAVEAFLDTEVERYRPQLERYAAAMSQVDARPLRVGLYFPLLRAFRSWTPQ